MSILEKYAPRRLAEEWDNTGLLTGDPADDIKGILVTLDVNRETVEEALQLGADFIVSHHPLIFKPIKNIRKDLPFGRLLIDLINNDIGVYCAHTNLDNASGGVNQVLANLLGLQEIEILNPDKIEKYYKIVVFIPETHADEVRDAMTGAGAGWIGGYSDCTFSVNGTGTFRAGEGCNPFLGEKGVLEKADEVRLETIIRENMVDRVIKAMIKAHPYEEVAYDVYELANQGQRFGLGRVGKLPEAVSMREFVNRVKKLLGASLIRYGGNKDKTVRKIAVCGGSGAGLIHKAVFLGADVFLTGDLKYHEAQDAINHGLNFVDAGHYATEAPVVGKLAGLITKALAEAGSPLPVYVSKINYDPFRYC